MINIHEQNDSFTTDILSKQGSSGITNQGYFLLRTSKQSTHYFPSAYLLNFISGVPSEGNAPPLSVCKTDLLLLQHEGFDFCLGVFISVTNIL